MLRRHACSSFSKARIGAECGFEEYMCKELEQDLLEMRDTRTERVGWTEKEKKKIRELWEGESTIQQIAAAMGVVWKEKEWCVMIQTSSSGSSPMRLPIA